MIELLYIDLVFRLFAATLASAGMLLTAAIGVGIFVGVPAFFFGLALDRLFRAIGLRLPDPGQLRRRFAARFPVPRLLLPVSELAN